jgi:Tfp pilus assembly protein PilF
MIRLHGAALLWVFFIVAFCSCSGLRTELYRAETRHLYEGACKFYKEGDFAAARAGFDAVIALDADYGPAHAALGNLALMREDYAKARAHYRQALAADPELADDLQSLVMVALAHHERAPLREAGVSLNALYPFIMADRQDEIASILAMDIPLLLLARDTVGITPGRLGEMQQKIAQSADAYGGSRRFRLFAGYLLFAGQKDDILATTLILSAVDGAAERDRQEAFVVLGQLYERQGEPNAAVDAFLAAVDAGLPLSKVAHHLARVYRVEVERILPSPHTAGEDRAPVAPMRIVLSTHLPPSPPVDVGAAAQMRERPAATPAGPPYTF